MTTEDALLAAVIADPDADTPRLVYADWLDDHGGDAGRDRAEFIRVQVELARYPGRHPDRVRLYDRQDALLGRHGKAWARAVARPGHGSVAFRRGFPDQLWTYRSTNSQPDTDLAAAPLAEGVVVRSPIVDHYSDRLDRRHAVRVRYFRGPYDEGDPRWRLRWHHRLAPAATTAMVDVLKPAPPAAEPFLLRGRWVVVAWPPGVRPNPPHAHTRLADGAAGPWAGRAVSVGTRMYRHPDECRTWCPVAVDWQEVWLAFEDGRLLFHEAGPIEPPGWINQWVLAAPPAEG